MAPLWAPLGSLAQGSWSLPQSPVARAHFVQSFVPVRRGGLEALNEVVAHVTGESRRFPSGRGLSAPSVLSVWANQYSLNIAGLEREIGKQRARVGSLSLSLSLVLMVFAGRWEVNWDESFKEWCTLWSLSCGKREQGTY